ncbi:MAG: ATP-binding cassette domain-containing protein [Chloroflexota bacterium]
MADGVLELRGISKSFPGVQAVDNLSVEFHRGEVHALVGENGAGKSTLMKIIAGAYQPDAGEMVLRGQKVQFRSPHDAQVLGISIVYQEFGLIPDMTVAENIFLGREPKTRWGLLDRVGMEQRAIELLERLDTTLDVRLSVSYLSVAQQQLVEIAKALSFDASLIIMDEPSAALTGAELERLFEIIESLKQSNVTIIYVSHRLEEVYSIADRVTVLRDGKWINTLPIEDTDRDGLVRMMVGRTLKETFPGGSGGGDEEALRVEGLCRKGVLRDISFVLHRGEILGIAGLVGSGRTELARAIFAADARDGGDVFVGGRKVDFRSPSDAMRAGIGFLTEDRKAEGLALGLSVRHNIALPSLDRRSLLGFVRDAEERRAVQASIDELEIRATSMGQEVRFLSGGNQQKVALAKWLNTEPQIIIFDEPTRGIDVGVKAEIYRLMREMGDDGKAILMISSELPEVLGMSDRIVVMHEGRIVGELAGKEATEGKVLSLACGIVGEPECLVPDDGETEVTPLQPQKRRRWAGMDPTEVSAYIIVLALVLLGTLVSPTFRTVRNMQNLARQVAGIGLVGIGQAFAVLIGGTDLSVGAIVTLTAVFSAAFMNGRSEMMIPAVLFCLAMGALIGLFNAIAIVKLRVPAFVATLGTMSLGGGIALAYTDLPIGRIAAPFRFLASGMLGPVPFALVFFLIFLAAAAFLLRKTPFGRHIYAVGGDPEIARLSGIAVDKVQVLSFVICSLAATMGGLYFSSRMGVGDPRVGGGLGFDSLVAVVVGGCRLGGGFGSVVGAVGGVLVIAILNNLLNFMNVNIWYQSILKGFIILLAVTLYRKKK